jgi:hypothetical protein
MRLDQPVKDFRDKLALFWPSDPHDPRINSRFDHSSLDERFALFSSLPR